MAQHVRVVGEALDQRRGAGVLPDDRVVHRRAGAPVPHDDGLTLVGDPERRDVARLGAGALERRRCNRVRALDDFQRVVLDEPRSGMVLGVLLLRGGDRRALLVEQHEPRRAGPLVERRHEPSHPRIVKCAPPAGPAACRASSFYVWD